jgi:hypothetical protein
MKRLVVIVCATVLAVAVLAAAGWIVLIFDPYEWGVVQSRDFTWEKFATIEKGEQIETVIARLGPPVRKPLQYTVLTNDPADPCIRGRCMQYIFAGANWGASYQEAIVIADARGRVVLAQARQE